MIRAVVASPDPNPDRSERLAKHLLARIHRRYQTVTESLQIARLTIPFTRILRPDTVLDMIVEEEDRLERVRGVRKSSDELHLPYWAELWDSALGVARFLVEHPLRPRLGSGRAVLDLGCGMGLSGTIAAAVGANVLLADLEPAPLLFARLNTLPYAERTRIRRVDWRRDRLSERFDLILGSDVLYERKQWDFLEPFFRTHLTPRGSVLLAEPGRQTGDAFPAWVTARGWTLQRFDQPVDTRANPIRIFVINPSAQ